MKTRFMSVLAAAFVALICGSAQAYSVTTNGTTRNITMALGEKIVYKGPHKDSGERWWSFSASDSWNSRNYTNQLNSALQYVEPSFVNVLPSNSLMSNHEFNDPDLTFKALKATDSAVSFYIYGATASGDSIPASMPNRPFGSGTTWSSSNLNPAIFKITVEAELRIPVAKTGYTYVVSNSNATAELKGVLANGTNSYSVANGSSVRVYFTLKEGYTWAVPPANNPMVVRVNNITTVELPTASRIMLDLTLPTEVEHMTYRVWDETAGKYIDAAGPGVYKVPYGDLVKVYFVPDAGYGIKTGNPMDLGAVTGAITVDAADLPKAEPGVTPTPIPQPVDEDVFTLYPNGDGGAFVAATKSTDTYNGALISSDGIEGTIQVKVKKPNKKTGLFDIQAKVVTLVDKATYSFKAKELSAPADGVLTVELPYSDKRSAGRALTVTLDGDSLTGVFRRADGDDGFRVEGVRDLFAAKETAKWDAVKAMYAGTWTGVFAVGAPDELFGAAFSVTINRKNGKASVKVLDADGKSMSCSSVCEVGANGVVAVPVSVLKSVKTEKGTVQRSFSFRIVFAADASGVVSCKAVDVSPMRDWAKTTDPAAAAIYCQPKFVAADMLTVTAKAFKGGYVTVFEPSMADEIGSVAKTSLKLEKTGLITGSVTVDVMATGKSATGKVAGVLVGMDGVGVVNVKLSKDLTVRYGFASAPAK